MFKKSDKKQLFFSIVYLFLPIFAILTFLSPSHVFGEFSESYISEEELLPGTIVSLSPDSPDLVVTANANNVNNIFGVVVEEGETPIHFSGTSEEEQQAAVSTSGEVYVFVSDINGDIQAGDAITATVINGVGGKATDDGRAIGIAKESFEGDEQNTNLRSIELETATGESTVYIGKIRVSLNVYDYIAPREERDILTQLQNTAEAIAEKPVSLVKVITASIISLITLVVVVIMLGSSVQGSMIALGRNPLAKKTIISSMVKVILLSVLVLTLGTATAYLALIS